MTNKWSCRYLLVVLLGLGWGGVAPAAKPPMVAPSDSLEHLTFYLMTVEVATGIADNFGHTGIRVINSQTGQDFIFNWGLYDFKDPLQFSFGFYFGDVTYKLGVYPFHYMKTQYAQKKRTMWQDRLDLRPAEKRIFWQRLQWNNRPENKSYQYQYFFDNCSTRPRDYLDEALGGAIKSLYAPLGSGASFRDMVRSHYQTNPVVALSLELLMNSNLDREMTVWEKMFLPRSLRDRLLSFHRPDGSPLLIAEGTVYEFPPPVPYELTGHHFLAIMMLLLLLPALLAGLAKRACTPMFWRLLSIPAVVFGLYTGTIGVLSVTNWLFSGHQDLYHNANIWVILPLQILLVVQGFYWLRKGHNLAVACRWRRLAYYYSWLQIFSLLVGLAAYLVGLIHQDLHLVYFSVAPFVALFAIINVWTLRQKRPLGAESPL